MNQIQSRRNWLLLLVVMIPFLSTLSGCSGSSEGKALNMAPMSGMPAEVQQAPETVRSAYQFAAANPDALKNVPCYCGCGAIGHTSNYSCFVQEARANGEIIFDQHALGCSICVDIAQGVMKMTREGRSAKEIRVSIDATFSKYGPSNMASTQ